MSHVIKFYFTSSVLNIFQTLIHPSSGACDFSILSPHLLCVLFFDVCWSFVGIRVAGWSLPHGYHPNQPKGICQSGTAFCKQTAVPDWQMPVDVCTVLNSWWWTERPSETCRLSFQNKINLIHWCIQLGFL